MKEVVDLEEELRETVERVHSVRTRSARLRDALERLEASAVQKQAETGARQRAAVRQLSFGRRSLSMKGSEAEMAQRVLRGLRKSEERLVVLQRLAASLSRAIYVKEAGIVSSILEERFLEEKEARAAAAAKRRGGTEEEGSGVPAPSQRQPQLARSATESSLPEPALSHRGPTENADSLPEPALSRGGPTENANSLSAEEVRQKAAERRRAVLALYQREVQEMVEEVAQKLKLLEITAQAPADGGESSRSARLLEAEKLEARLAKLLASINAKLLEERLQP